MALQVLFRLFPRFGVRNLNAITINYLTCIILGSLVTGSWPLHPREFDKPWFPYAIFLSVMFIIFFNINAYTIQKVGMVITSVFQKLSLVFPVLLGVLFFNESLGWNSRIAIPLALVSIVLSNFPGRSSDLGLHAVRRNWHLPLLVIFGAGLIEMCLFYIQEKGITGNANLHFTSCLFGMAAIWGSCFLLIRRQFNFTKNELIAGILVGIPNFFSIYLILKGLELGWKGAILFPVNNVGTIFLTALVGIFIFREKLSVANYLGLLFALVSVFLFSLS